MSDDASTTPTELRAPRGAKVMEIDWADGVTTHTRHAVLRGFCPCAHCQGHQGPIRWADAATDEDLDVIEIEEVGNYALRIVFGDGHSTGIFTFRFLRALGAIGDKRKSELGGERFGR